MISVKKILNQHSLPTMPATLTKKSAFSNKTRTMSFPQYEQDEFEKRMLAWKNGMLIQDAFPNLSDNAREFILTGATADEWDEYFSEKDSVKRREGE